MRALILAAVLFGLGVYGVLTRRDLIVVLGSIEVMLGGANVWVVAVSTTYRFPAGASASVSGATAGLLVLVLAAAEAAVGLALLTTLVRRNRTRVDDLKELSG